MLLLNIQFWSGDRKQAMELARFMADLEPAMRHDACVLFSARFDCKHDEDTMKYVAQKFRVFKFTGKRKHTGWPAGPNQLMGESYEFVIEALRFKKLPPEVDAVMFIEADCVPLSKDWITKLYAEYRSSGRLVGGAWLKKDDAGIEHINGNCIISTRFWEHCPQIFWPPNQGGWDALLAGSILPHAYPSRFIWSDYQLGQEHNPWRGCDYLWAAKRYGAKDNVFYGQDLYPVWFHGIKVASGLKCARARLLNK
jgi:hypothetical protein